MEPPLTKSTTVTAALPPPAPARTGSVTLTPPASGVAVRPRRNAPLQSALDSKIAATSVVEVRQGGVLATSLLSPSLALVGTRNAHMVGVALCAYVEAEDIEEPFLVFPIQFALPLSEMDSASVHRLYGAVVANAVLMAASAVALWFVRASHERDGKLLPAVSAMWIALSVYFGPNMVRVAVTLVTETQPTVAGLIVVGLCGFVMPLVNGIAVPTWLLMADRFRVEMRWALRSHLRPSESRPPELLDPLSPSSRPSPTEYKPAYIDRSGGDGEPFFVDAFAGLFDGFRDAVRSPPRRFTHVVDLTLCFVLSALAGLRPSSSGACGAVAIAMLALSAAPLIYFVALRPFVSRLESGLVMTMASLQLVVGALVVNVALRDESDGTLRALGWADLCLSALSIVALLAIAGHRGLLALRRRNQESSTTDVGASSSASAPLLAVPTSEGQSNHGQGLAQHSHGEKQSSHSFGDKSSGEQAPARPQNPLARGS